MFLDQKQRKSHDVIIYAMTPRDVIVGRPIVPSMRDRVPPNMGLVWRRVSSTLFTASTSHTNTWFQTSGVRQKESQAKVVIAKSNFPN